MKSTEELARVRIVVAGRVQGVFFRRATADQATLEQAKDMITLEGSARALPIPVTPIRPIPLHVLRRFYVAAAGSWYRFLDAME